MMVKIILIIQSHMRLERISLNPHSSVRKSVSKKNEQMTFIIMIESRNEIYLLLHLFLLVTIAEE